MPLPPALSWYVLHTKPHCEAVVVRLLTKAAGLPSFFPEVVQRDRQPPLWVPLFPGYLFLQLDPTAPPAALHTPGVVGLVGPAGQPTPVAAAVIEELRARVALINAHGGLPCPLAEATATGLHGLAAAFGPTLAGPQRVQRLLAFLACQPPPDNSSNPALTHPPRRTRGKGRPIRGAP